MGCVMNLDLTMKENNYHLQNPLMLPLFQKPRIHEETTASVFAQNLDNKFPWMSRKLVLNILKAPSSLSLELFSSSHTRMSQSAKKIWKKL